MKLFLNVERGVVIVRARAEGPDAIGDLMREVRPGGHFYGVPYATLRKAGAGEHSLAELQRMAKHQERKS